MCNNVSRVMELIAAAAVTQMRPRSQAIRHQVMHHRPPVLEAKPTPLTTLATKQHCLMIFSM